MGCILMVLLVIGIFLLAFIPLGILVGMIIGGINLIMAGHVFLGVLLLVLSALWIVKR
ncbi:hypothetical protein [Ligilactobacillus cholophilus]|uniref:hypothetical protein n=1 Tax=Ligilactobacillus cholophilus TaxID=3050131 RepID=UPI0025B23B64|nr:hypothetical protein [Ligilactobacillus cholophilus]